MRVLSSRLAGMIAAITLAAFLIAPPGAALAAIGDVSVGGIWVCRITQGAAGLTLEQRVRQINQRIVDVLSLPGLAQRQIVVEVRPVAGAAAIVAAGITVITVTPADAAGTGVPVHEVANQWGTRLAQGLRRALPDREILARMYAPPPGPGLEYDTQRLVEITWYWRGTMRAGTWQLRSDDPRRYTVRFSQDGRLAVQADCNRGMGTYVRRGQILTVSVQAVTRAACPPGSLERQFLSQLNRVDLMSRRADDLALRLRGDLGTMIFGQQSGEGHVTGTVTYRQRSALPPDATVEIWLQEVPKGIGPAVLLGYQTIATRGRQVPIPFDLTYDPARVNPNTVIVIRAAITAGGQMLFRTTTDQRVITGGYPSTAIEVMVQPAR